MYLVFFSLVMLSNVCFNLFVLFSFTCYSVIYEKVTIFYFAFLHFMRILSFIHHQPYNAVN